MDFTTKRDLILRDLQEAQRVEVMDKIIDKRPLVIYWGTAPTGRIHLGYFAPLHKIADFLKAGCIVKILFADLHAFLDNMKSDLKSLENRTEYYEIMIVEILKCLNVDISKLEFIRGESFQLTPAYTFDVYRINSVTSVTNAKRAGAEVVKKSDNPPMTGLLYPTLQALDEVHLRVDAQFGGIDQRKIFAYATDFLPKLEKNKFDKSLKYNKRIHLMTEMIPGISTSKKENKDSNDITDEINNKMSASDNKTKLDLLDGKGAIRKKIKSAFCAEGDIEDNTLMVILEKLLFKLMRHRGEKFVILRTDEHGGNVFYEDIESVKKDFSDKKLHPDDFKNGIVDYINNLIDPIRKAFDTPERRKLVSAAYKTR